MPRKDSKYTGDGPRKADEKLAAHLSSRNYRVHVTQHISSYIEGGGRSEYMLVFGLMIFHCLGRGLGSKSIENSQDVDAVKGLFLAYQDSSSVLCISAP